MGEYWSMWTNLRNHINILYEASMEGPRNEESRGKVQENKEGVDKAKLDLMTKEMLEEFLRGKGRNEAVDFLHKYSQNAEKILDAQTFKELSKRRNDLIMWSTFGGPLFGGAPNGEWKPLTKSSQTTLLEILGIRKIDVDFSKAEKLQEIKEMQDFVNKNHIEAYASEWARICLKNPHQIESGKGGKIAQVLAGAFGKETTNSLGDELKKLESMKQLPSEYKSVIKTLVNITSSKEFRNYSGGLDKLNSRITGHSSEFNDFQNKFRAFVVLSAKQKKEFTKEDFDRHFDEKAKLKSEEELIRDVKYHEIRQGLDSIQGKDEKLKYLSNKQDEMKKSGFSKALEFYINIKIGTLIVETKGLANDDISGQAGSLMRNFLSKTNESDVRKQARELTEKTHTPYFAHLNSSTGNYEVISAAQIAHDCATNIQNVNRGLFQNLLSLTNWQQFFKGSIGDASIAGVGWYIQNVKQDSSLFVGYESKKNFFIQTYEQTKNSQKVLLDKAGDTLKTGDFTTLFPNLSKNPRITPEIQELIKRKELGNVYDKLAQSSDITNGEIGKIMDLIEQDGKSLAERATKATKDLSEKLGKKTLYDIRDSLDLSKEDDAIKFEKIKSKSAAGGALLFEEEKFLKRIAKPGTDILSLLQSTEQAKLGASTQSQANVLKRIAGKNKVTEKAGVLTLENKERVKQAGIVGETRKDTELTNIQSNLNIDGMKGMSDTKRIQKLEELAGKDPRTLNNTEKRLLEALIVWKNKYAQEAHAVNQYIRTAGKDEAIALIRETSGYSRDEEAEKYINKQVFLSKYVEEKNFVDMVEKNAAYMNLGETKSIGELHGMNKVDISSMSSDSESIKLGETSIMGHNSFAGMSALMNCRVEVGESGVFSRTIRTPEGQIIAENIPLENISTTIQQLARFYTIGLGPLVPKMKEVNAYISKVRPDAIGGTDGTYGIKEDEKFLRIMATMLYGEEKLPGEKNIPNLIRVFNQPGRENEPSFALKQKGILTETGGINTTKLGEHLQSASSKI